MRLNLTYLVTGGLAAAAMVPASALAGTVYAGSVCAETPTSKPFLPFGDLADYSLAPEGDFETGTSGWALTNARVIDANETLGVTPGTHALQIGASPTGGDAIVTSPEFCVTPAHPSFRYVVRASGATAKVDLTTVVSYRPLSDPTKIVNETKNSGLTYTSAWRPSAINPLATLLPWKNVTGGQIVRVSLRIPAKSLAAGGLVIDSVMVDPYRRS